MTKHEDSPHLMIQTWVLDVKLFCLYCAKHQEQLKDVLRKIDGVLNVTIIAAEEKVTVTGNVASAEVLLKNLLQCEIVREADLCPVAHNRQQNNDSKTREQRKEQEIGKDGGRDANGESAVAQSKTQDKSNTRRQQREQKSTGHKGISYDENS